MAFKNTWEKTNQRVQIEASTIGAMLHQALPNEAISLFEVISGGCANLNFKVNVEKRVDPLILRIYLRDQEAAYREQKLAALIRDKVPIPEVYFVGDLDSYRFAITQFKEGITLRDLLLNIKPVNIGSVMSEAGLLLANIQNYTFSCSGCFDKDLQPMASLSQEDFFSFSKKCLVHPIILQQFTKDNLSKIQDTLERYGSFFPDGNQRHLVHADFDPANILVSQIDGNWRVSGILDWEFSFSGSTLCDVANMLRYAHLMPKVFQESFLKGLQLGGVHLPDNWQISIDLLNLMSLLDCLTRSSPSGEPNRCTDIHHLIAEIINRLDIIK